MSLESAAAILEAAIRGPAAGPGVIVGVVTKDGLLTTRSRGTMALRSADPLDDRTAFYVASVSKQFTAACVFLAVEEGHLRLEDRLRSFLPDLPSWSDEVSVRHLLNHASGLPDYGQLIEASGRSILEPFGDGLILDVLAASDGPVFVPGSNVSYSNTGYVLLAMVIRAATGVSLRGFAGSHIFGPLRMDATHYRDDYTETVPRLADGHVIVNEQIARFDSCFDRVGDGGVITTLADWALWESVLLEGQEPWLSVADRLTTPFDTGAGTTSDWRAGVVVDRVVGKTAILAGGTGLGFRAFSARLPTGGFSVCCLSNLETSDVRGLSLGIVERLHAT